MLGEDAKAAVRAASVFGQTFRLDGVRALLGGQARRIDVRKKLQFLSEREVIFARGSPSDREYAFRHALIREAAYLLLPEEESRLGHRLAGEWLEAQGSAGPALLAQHYERGAAPERAAGWYRVAATEALEAGSLEDVVRSGERAVACGLEGEQLGEVASLVAEALSYGGDDGRAADWAATARKQLLPGAPAWWRASQVLATAHLRKGTSETSEVFAEILLLGTATAIPEQVIAVAFIAANCFVLAHHEFGEEPSEPPPHGSPRGLGWASAGMHRFSPEERSQSPRAT